MMELLDVAIRVKKELKDISHETQKTDISRSARVMQDVKLLESYLEESPTDHYSIEFVLRWFIEQYPELEERVPDVPTFLSRF